MTVKINVRKTKGMRIKDNECLSKERRTEQVKYYRY